MEGKDIIFFLSSGKVNILESHRVIQKIKHKPNGTIIATMFLGSPMAKHIATWIIVLSIALGILLLILLILALIKIGFFNRNKKKELEALKSETNVSLLKHFSLYYKCIVNIFIILQTHGIILETCSSTDIIHEE